MYIVMLWRVRITTVAMETQKWVSFALLSNYKILNAVINNINVPRPSNNLSDIFAPH